MHTRYLAITLLAATLVGCNASSAPSAVAVIATARPTPTPSPLHSPTPQPTPSQEKIRAVAAQAYVVAATRANFANDRLDMQYRNARTLTSYQNYWKAVARVDHTFLPGWA